jgi:hypothetical protein
MSETRDEMLMLSFAPKDLRMYADEVVNHYGCEGLSETMAEAFRWLLTCDDDTLRSVGSYAIESDDLWSLYRALVDEAVCDGYKTRNDGRIHVPRET